MRLTKFINERIEIPNDKEVTELLLRKCGKWIKESNGEPAYRGMLGKKQWGKFNVRQDRQPKDSPKVYHEMMDKDFKKEFGWFARSAGLFVTGNEDTSDLYGDPYVIFPIDNFRYIWSQKIQDLLQVLPEKTAPTTEHEHFIQVQWPEILNGYQDSYLAAGLRAGHEIMVQCKSYYALHYSLWKYYDFEGILKGWS